MAVWCRRTLVVDGEVVDGCSVSLSGRQCTAGEMDVMSRTQYEHPPAVNHQPKPTLRQISLTHTHTHAHLTALHPGLPG